MSGRASFNDSIVGDSVTFELLSGRINGARALSVRRPTPRVGCRIGHVPVTLLAGLFGDEAEAVSATIRLMVPLDAM